MREVDASREVITILIAHRLSTVMHADRIYVLERGKIVEVGQHEDLLERTGLYYAMWRQQVGERRTAPQLLDGLRRRRPDRPDRHGRGRGRTRPAALALRDGDEGGDCGRDRPPARAREARRDALLLRGADPARDRRGPGRDRVPGLAAPHEGDSAPQGAALGPPGPRRPRVVSTTTRIRICLLVRTQEATRRGSSDRAGKDPQHRRRRTPRSGEELARGGPALPGREDEPAGHDRGRDDGGRLGRRRAEAADVAVGRPPQPRMAGA